MLYIVSTMTKYELSGFEVCVFWIWAYFLVTKKIYDINWTVHLSLCNKLQHCRRSCFPDKADIRLWQHHVSLVKQKTEKGNRNEEELCREIKRHREPNRRDICFSWCRSSEFSSRLCKQGECSRLKLENLKMLLHYYWRDIKWINQLEIKS